MDFKDTINLKEYKLEKPGQNFLAKHLGADLGNKPSTGQKSPKTKPIPSDDDEISQLLLKSSQLREELKIR